MCSFVKMARSRGNAVMIVPKLAQPSFVIFEEHHGRNFSRRRCSGRVWPKNRRENKARTSERTRLTMRKTSGVDLLTEPALINRTFKFLAGQRLGRRLPFVNDSHSSAVHRILGGFLPGAFQNSDVRRTRSRSGWAVTRERGAPALADVCVTFRSVIVARLAGSEPALPVSSLLY
jgi:hypothetical protein